MYISFLCKDMSPTSVNTNGLLFECIQINKQYKKYMECVKSDLIYI